MKHQILQYQVDVSGNKVTMVLIADTPEAADALATTLDAKLASGTIDELEPMEKPDE